MEGDAAAKPARAAGPDVGDDVSGSKDGSGIAPVEEARAEFGHRLELEEQTALEKSIVEMALSKIEGVEGLFVGG